MVGAGSLLLSGRPTQGLRVGGKKDKKGSPLSNIRISGQGPGSTLFLTDMAASHLVLKSAELLFSNTCQPRCGSRPFPTGAPVGKERTRVERGAASGSHQGQDKDGIAATI